MLQCLSMETTFRNLVPDSTLLQETIELLRLRRGRASAREVADAILELPALDADTAALLVSELISDDWRLRLTDAGEVELVCEDDECRALAEHDYIVFDVETTGPKTPPGRIMEIGAYRVSRGRIVGEFKTLVNQQMSIPPFIVQLTGITDEMVKHAPLFGDVVADWLGFVDTAVLVAHNASFDVRFINHEIALVYPGRRLMNPHLCTVSLSRRVMPELANHRLHTLAEHFAVPFRQRHRASHDARATAEVFIGILEILSHYGVRDLAGARRFRADAGGQRPDAV